MLLRMPSVLVRSPSPATARHGYQEGSWHERAGSWDCVLCLECAGRYYCPGCINTYQRRRGMGQGEPDQFIGLQHTRVAALAAGDHLCHRCEEKLRDPGELGDEPLLTRLLPPRTYDYRMVPTPRTGWPRLHNPRSGEGRQRKRSAQVKSSPVKGKCRVGRGLHCGGGIGRDVCAPHPTPTSTDTGSPRTTGATASGPSPGRWTTPH